MRPRVEGNDIEDNMNIYWDLSEKDRANLTREDIEQYIDTELMRLGVLKVKPLVLDPVPTFPQPAQRYFRVRCGHYFLDVAFDRQEEAQAFIALNPKRVDMSHLGHESHNFAIDMSDEEIEIVSVSMFDRETFTMARDDLRQADAVKASNNKKQHEYDEAIKKQKQVLSGLWNNWSECKSKCNRLRRVLETFADYQRIATDPVVAARFLAKAFSRGEIAETVEWFGVTIDVPPDAFSYTRDAPQVRAEENDTPF